ncbi:MAG: GTP-binding protein [Promethearchaeota archaeon]
MIKTRISLSLWDIAGQKRFDFLKSDFFKGTAAVAVVFDLTRPETFNAIDQYFQEIRKRAGNIPIILVGNKCELKEQIGEIISREQIIQKVNKFNLLEYVETSALKNINVNMLFYRLSIAALLDLKPRLGEMRKPEDGSSFFQFKIILAGPAAVGKSSLIKRFINLDFSHDYKLTVGLDFLSKGIEVDEQDLPPEARKIIQKAISKYKKREKQFDSQAHHNEEEKALREESSELSANMYATNQNFEENHVPEKIKFTSRKIYLIISLILIVVLFLLLFLFMFSP